MNSIFNSSMFEQTTLTAAINAAIEGQAVPNVVDALFNEEGIATRTAEIELLGNTLSLVPSQPYGSPGDITSLDKRKAKGVSLIHLPTSGAVWAHEVGGVRAFGSPTEMQTVEAKRNQVLAKMRARIEATIRYHRIKALQGQILDANGSVLLDVFATFEVQQQTQDFKFSVAATDIKLAFETAKEKSEDALGDSTAITGFRCFAGRGFYNAFTTHATTKDAFKFFNGGAFLGASQAKQPFSMYDIEFVKLYGKVGDTLFIAENEAYLVPVVADPDAYITRFGPANYMESINTLGLPYYAKSAPIKFDKGVEMEAQSNVINLPTKPRSIIKLTMS